MAGELVAQLMPRVFIRETAAGYEPVFNAAIASSLAGLRLQKITLNGYNTVFQVPANLTMATGVTLSLLLVDSGEYPSDLGLVVSLGFTFKRLLSGETCSFGVGAGAEQTANVTLQATSGQMTLATLAVANANLDSAVVGDFVAMRMRRLAAATTDTAQGSVIYLGGSVKNT